MKNIKILLLTLCLIFTSKAFALHQLYADRDGVSIPYGTKLELSMAQDVTTRSAFQGDMIQAYLTKDIYVNNKLILPARTLFRGRIVNIDRSKSFSRSAKMAIVLDHLVTPRGTQLAINSGLSSNFGYILKNDTNLTTNGNYFTAVKRDFKKAGKIVPRTIKWGATSGDNLFVGAKILFVPVAAVGGVVACVGSSIYNTAADLFRHGDEVILKKNSIFTILLLSTLEIPS